MRLLRRLFLPVSAGLFAGLMAWTFILPRPRAEIECVAQQVLFSQDGSLLATFSWSTTDPYLHQFDVLIHGEPRGAEAVKIWDVATGREVASLDLGGRWTVNWVFPPGGRHIAAMTTAAPEPPRLGEPC